MDSEACLQSVLDRIEEQESRLLVWGLTDACLSRDEAFGIIDPILETAIADGLEGFFETGDVIDALLQRGLLFEVEGSSYSGYRSRMAETVRLLFYLRQVFPKHAGRDGWQHARTLVSDFRFSRRRRRYPKREIDAANAFAVVSKSLNTQSTANALRKLLLERGEGFALSDFQVRATSRILNGLEQKRYAGTLISAGTGSGKTLAFYIPALARIATHVMNERSGSKNWVKCLALYPRTELLKDQFSEIYGEARRLDPLTTQQGRKIRIGAFFGATPYNAKSLLDGKIDGWEKTSDGFRCGFMACPTTECGGDLIWRETDLRQDHEHLICSSCGSEIADDEVILTRRRLETNPPDILFTTTEMLNQRLSDSRFRHLFGLRPQASRPPEMMLLDEVHTYSGFHGAQVAYLLRRWSHLVKAPISFVGLSATLRDGSRFFARLTGLYESQIEEISPKHMEMTAEGAEYLVALKGDPVSRTSLLSTTIQTAMLLSRMLDRPDGAPSDGVFGNRIFAFTDDIDVINRLYFGLLDAEGRNSAGNADMVRHPNGGLAVLRAPIPSISRERNGQNWAVPQSIGHDLSDRKRVGRTSSQDPGVIAGLDVVVATASLEVGFNDPTVGAVIQHKAPRAVASFLQRKGRAGRSRKMRPWTVLVLSDYGRDRQAYQSYDRLFDPELTVQAIPLSSRYIQHIQAVYSLIDFLGSRLSRSLGKGSVWADLSGPISGEDRYKDRKRNRQKLLCECLAGIVRESHESELLHDYLARSLRVSEDEANAVLWEHPRPLLTTVIPTALRRLSTNWRRDSQPTADFYIPNSPLPDFAPANLFSDLNLPEVRISLPLDWQDSKPRTPEAMPIAQAMRTFAPGRVSRRFGVQHADIRHWVVPENFSDLPVQQLEINTFYNSDPLGDWQISEGGTAVSIPVFRPFEIKPVQPGRSIRDTSNAQLIWRSQIVKRNQANDLIPPHGTMWEPILTRIEAYTHGEQSPAEIRRFAIGSNAEIQIERQDGIRTRFDYVQDNAPVALGFSMTVDALRFKIGIPGDLSKESETDAPEKWSALRTARFFDLIWTGDHMPLVPNPFLRQWLGTIFFSSLTYEALNQRTTLQEADAAIKAGESSVALADILNTLFQSPAIAEDDVEVESTVGRDQLREELEVLLRDQEVLESLRRTAQVLWTPVDVSWQSWLEKRYKTTIAAAAFNAISNLCPDMETDGLMVDIDPGPRAAYDEESESDTGQEFWISETTPGGTGHIEEFITRYAEDPRRFYSLLSAALHPNEYELIDYQLVEILKGLSGTQANAKLVERVQAFRGAKSASETEKAFGDLRHTLTRQDFVLFHSFATALNNRILRPGTSIDSDQFLFEVLSFWQQEEARLGVELEPRTIAYFFSHDNKVDDIVTQAGFPLPEGGIENWRFNVIYGMLWPRGATNRRQGLDLYNPFYELPNAEPLLVTTHFSERAKKVLITNEDWQEQAIDALSKTGIVTLTCPASNRSQLSPVLNFFATNPIASDYLSVFARLDAIRRAGATLEVDLELAEVSQ
jgi:DEAD/DEAH box helicase/Helicase conserved C-terminal domain